MDLVTVPEAAWFEFDERMCQEMAEKRRLLADGPRRCLRRHAGVRCRAAEALELIVAALTAHHPDWFGREGTVLRNHLTGEIWDAGSMIRWSWPGGWCRRICA